MPHVIPRGRTPSRDMKDQDCVQFLQETLPRLRMRWPGFRRVRTQVCKRLQRRIDELGLADVGAYQAYLGGHDDEWERLDGLCQVTVSRFWRDKAVFVFLQEQVFPGLVTRLEQERQSTLRIWCAGCGAGEEPYSLALLWFLGLQTAHPALEVAILGTDIKPVLLGRAQRACYPYSAIKNLPPAWRESAFVREDGDHCLRAAYRAPVEFLRQDLREALPPGVAQQPFHLVCCRNLAFTYYDEALQRETAQRLQACLVPGGILLLGVHERLPAGVRGFAAWSERLGVYRRVQ